MRLRAPAVSGAAVVLAVALVWYFRPGTELPLAFDREALPVQPVPVASETLAPAADAETRGVGSTPPAEAGVAEEVASAAPSIDRAPLPGETPSTPMANLVAGHKEGPPPGLIEGELEFAAEPVDTAWARGAESDLFARLAQMPGLKLIDLQVECRSTMCRLQLTQPSGIRGGARPFNVMLDPVGLERRWLMSVQDSANGPIKSVTYLWRDGFAPAKPEPGQPHESN
jgi:hypothetical protein